MDVTIEAVEIGEHTKVHTDGYSVTVHQERQGEPAQEVSFQPHEAIAFMHFIDDQARLRELMMASIRRKAAEAVSPEWRFNATHQCWQYFRGPAHIELAPRPLYCDRGRWAATCSGVGDLDGADGFPMYFQDLERAKLEMQAWLEHRMRDYQHTQVNQKLDVLNRLRDLRAAVVHMVPHLERSEAEPLAKAFDVILGRLAPSGIDRD
jgi:hypothetical protein